jgi:hypothetical protein
MKILTIAALLSLIPGCTVLSALGLGTTDVLPSLKYCDDVQYIRTQTKLTIKAECRVPAGG